MNIKKIAKEQLEDIRKLDCQCFERSEKRSVENITALWEISNGGSWIGEKEDELVAYIFTHIYGSVGTIGPLGVVEKHRKNGYAKLIIKTAVEYLYKNGCTTIGLEVLPEKVENIGLYLSMGFRFVQPSVLFHLKCNEYNQKKKYVTGNSISIKLLKKFDAKFVQKHRGYSLYNDINWVVNHNPENVIFVIEKGEIEGFLSYNTELYKYVWGYMGDEFCDHNVINNMLGYLGKVNSCNVLPIRVNLNYFDLLKKHLPNIYIEKVIERMVLSNKESESITGLICRSWIG